TTRHAQAVTAASHDEIAAMLQAPYEPTVQLGLAELERRFNPEAPDWDLLHQLLTNARPAARTLGQRWLRLSAMHWLGDVERIVLFLGLPHPNQQALVVEMVVPALAANRSLRELVADRIVAVLRGPEPAPAAHEGYRRVAEEALTEECNQRLTVAELAQWLERGSGSAQLTAARLRAARRD